MAHDKPDFGEDPNESLFVFFFVMGAHKDCQRDVLNNRAWLFETNVVS